MQAIVVTPPAPGALLVEVPAPERPAGSVRVAMQELGVCGTDRDITAGKYGQSPPGHTGLILGHENLGRVVEAAEGGLGPPVGEWVVASVRRGCGRCGYCAISRSDLCSSDGFTERGIRGLDGYGATEYVERPEYLLPIPAALAPVAVLMEPLSVVEKAVRVGREIQQARLPAVDPPTPLRALVAGSGAIGMLAAAVLTTHGYSVTVVDRHPGPTPAARMLERVGATHVTLEELPPTGPGGGFPLMIEATGASDLPFRLTRFLAPDGALVLTGIPESGGAPQPVAAGDWARSVVLGNRLFVGSVNAASPDFRTGLRDLTELERAHPGWLAGLITARRDFRDAPEILGGRVAGEIKTVLTFR